MGSWLLHAAVRCWRGAAEFKNERGVVRNITFISAYYENPGMLERHYMAFAALPEQIRKCFKIIIVDDGSPQSPATPPRYKIGVPVEIYRIKVDIRWNQDACRNLGASRANGWLLLTDIDHMLPELTATRIVMGDLDEDFVYKFARVSAPAMEFYKPHPNSWLMTRGMFEKIGGYDERFAGCYGTDWDIRDRALAAAPIVQLDCPLIRVPREVTPDASTTQYKRKTPEDSERIKMIREQRGALGSWKCVRLSFPWERVA